MIQILTQSFSDAIEKAKALFSRSTTWINLESLSYNAVSNLVSRTLRQSNEDCQQLSRLIHAVSLGNPFSVRNMLATLQRQHHVGCLRLAQERWANGHPDHV